jgi:acyl-CoA thioester hydrolase
MDHVNNANHITYFETARVQYYKDIFTKPIDWNKTGMILARTEINYFIPIFLDDDVYCYSKITSIGNKSFEISNLLTKRVKDHEVECAEGKSVIVCMDYEKQQTIEVPQEWRDAVKVFEGEAADNLK